MVPYPFSKGLFLYGEPLWIPKEADDEMLETARLTLEHTLNRLTEQAEREVGQRKSPCCPPTRCRREDNVGPVA